MDSSRIEAVDAAGKRDEPDATNTAKITVASDIRRARVGPSPALAGAELSEALLTPSKLHIGGQVRADGWTVVDIQPGPVVDIVASCLDLAMIGDGCVAEIYASHILEHLAYSDVPRALAEWHRVLAPDGRLSISVPDLAKLGPVLAHPRLEDHVRDWVINVIYGGQLDEHDFHKSGFTFETLSRYLKDAGFGKIMRVNEFDLFEDSSALRLGQALISLNMVARKPEAAPARG